ncbi:hypothetical protein L2744_11135 [Shewanella profunda]|uniref:hypothetical protein n=1 Tax=Shewanella profunda TaxID=254793 RepID=UPI00200C7CE0|nr:hypothetical protein [Shewanella profunda]MCL1090138.1 hypothetical protein [Shewanella profunda]
MKKTSLALVTALTMLGSVAANAADTGTTTGGATTGGAVGTMTAGAIAAGAVVAGVVVAANGSDGNPITSTSTNSTTGSN